MSKFRGRGKRWKRKIYRARWRAHKKEQLARGWVEVAENTLVPPRAAKDYPPYVPTHLGGTRDFGSRIKSRFDLPRRGAMKDINKFAKRFGVTPRQYMKDANWFEKRRTSKEDEATKFFIAT